MNKHYSLFGTLATLVVLVFGVMSSPATVSATGSFPFPFPIPGWDTAGGSYSYNTCKITSNFNEVTAGGSVTLTWETTGFDVIEINGQAVSGASGSVTFTNIQQNTTYTLVAKTTDGSQNCTTNITVTCVPVVPKECKLELLKSVDKTNAVVGDVLTYTIKIKNTGTGDCTGGGVRIEDVVDSFLAFQSQTTSNNITAGYGASAVYTSADRTLRWNGDTLTPGEEGTITWKGKVTAPSTCGDFEIPNQAKATAKELNNFQDWVYSNIVKTFVDYDCTQPPVCPLTPKADRIILNFADIRLRSDQGTAQAFSQIATANIPANKYDITLVSWDGYIGRETVSQPHEQYKIEFMNGSTPFAASNAISDLADNVIQATNVELVNTSFNLTSAATGVRAVHAFYPDTSSPNSLKPICVALDKIPEIPQPSCDLFTATPGAITVGNSAQLQWETTNATNVTMNNNIGTVALDGTLTVSPTTTTTYVLTVTGVNNQTVNCSVPVTVSELPAPRCDSFTAIPSVITNGEYAELQWNTTNATRVVINNGIGDVTATGTKSVRPLTTTTYIMTVFGANNQSVTCEVPVTVTEKKVPVCESFVASPTQVPFTGGTTTLTWVTSNATNVSIAPNIGTVALDGSKDVFVTTGTTFILTAELNGDKVTCPATVSLQPESDVFTCGNNVTFSAADTSITRGNSTELNWNVSGADSVSISVINASTFSGTQTIAPTTDTTYVLTATKGTKSIECPVNVTVGGGGGGGSSSPRCELTISAKKIKLGESVRLRWDTTRATEVVIKDNFGKTIFTTENMLADEKKEYYDDNIEVTPTRDTKYILVASRGSRDVDCEVKVEIEDDVVVLQTRDQQPLVAGISLSQVPYTGFEAGPFMTFMFYALLVAWALYITYLIVSRERATVVVPSGPTPNQAAMKKAEEVRPDVFTQSVSAAPAAPVVPTNLPTGLPVAGYPSPIDAGMTTINPHHANDALVTEIENRAHAQKALLSSDAVRHFVATTEGSVERNEALDQVVSEAKKSYPLEDGWIVINEARMRNLCETCQVSAESTPAINLAPEVVPQGTGSLAEAIVTGNVVAAYEMIGNRPMFSLADAAADLDAIYRNRQGDKKVVSELLKKETAKLSNEQIKSMIEALTSALDGTYTDEASAVKMAIMKAVKAGA